jgi:hypothetical protein
LETDPAEADATTIVRSLPGAQFEIRIDGTPRTYRDRKDYAMEFVVVNWPLPTVVVGPW